MSNECKCYPSTIHKNSGVTTLSIEPILFVTYSAFIFQRYRRSFVVFRRSTVLCNGDGSCSRSIGNWSIGDVYSTTGFFLSLCVPVRQPKFVTCDIVNRQNTTVNRSRLLKRKFSRKKGKTEHHKVAFLFTVSLTWTRTLSDFDGLLSLYRTIR